MLKLTVSAAIVAGALAFPIGQGQAQVQLKLVAGPTFSTVATDEWDTSTKTGFFVAVGTAFPLGERFAVMPHVGYVQKGTEFSDDTKGSYDYIEIPILIGTKFPLGEKAELGISAGPQVAFNINCDEDGFDCSEYDDFKGTEFGIVGGAGVGFPLSDSKDLSFGASVDFGLTDVFDSVDGGYKNRVYYLWASIGTQIGG
jgi:hypothetical protein